MSLRKKSWAVLVVTSVVFAAPALAADDPKLKDLTAVVALLGLPCGQVVSATQLKENDHLATCKDGNRYHVHVDVNGRVVAEKQ